MDITSKEILEQALNQYTGTVLYVSHDRYFINRTATRILELTGETFINYIGNYDYYLEKRELMNQLYVTNSRQTAGAKAEGSSGIKSGSGVKGSSGTDFPSASAPGPKSPLHPGADSGHSSTPGSRSSAAAHPATTAGSISPDSPAGKNTVKQDWKSQKEEQALQRKKQNALKKTEAQIAALEEQDAALDHQLTQPEVVSDVGKLMEIHKEKEAIKERLDQLYEEWEALAEDI